MEYELSRLSDDDLATIYKWKTNENNHEYYTCRPLKLFSDYDEFKTHINKWANTEGNIYLLLRDKKSRTIIGEIKGFDYNIRNQSMEFGYYLPQENRNSGHGTKLLELFIDFIFDSMILNKLYATTADCNESSKSVLLKNGFNLDGKNRQHYWIGNKKYDQLIYSLLREEWKS